MIVQEKETYNLAKGVWLALLVWLIFTVMNALSRNVQQTTNISMILLFQNTIGVLFTLPYAIKHRPKDWSEFPFKLLFVRSLTAQLNIAFLLLSLTKIPLANAMLLNNSAPIFIPFIMLIWLKNKIPNKAWIGIIIGFIGILLILKPTREIFNTGAYFALLAALSTSVSMIGLRLLATKIDGLTVSFYYFLLGLILTIPASIFYWELDSWMTAFNLLGIGILMLLGQFVFVKSFQYAKPYQLGPISYVAVVYAAFIDWIVWKEIPDYITVAGMILVTVSGILTILESKINYINSSKKGT